MLVLGFDLVIVFRVQLIIHKSWSKEKSNNSLSLGFVYYESRKQNVTYATLHQDKPEKWNK